MESTTRTPATRAAELPERGGSEAEVMLERDLARHIVRAVVIAIPLMVAFWVGVMALAISFTDAGFEGPLAMGAGIGVLAGIFWGAWEGFAFMAPVLDRADADTEPHVG